MKKILVAALTWFVSATGAIAQIPGLLPADNLFGNASGSTALPGEVPLVNCSTAALVYSTGTHTFTCNQSPTFTTSATTPLLIGGTAASSTLTLESTSGVGTTDAIIFNTGSQVERMRIDTNGLITIGGVANQTSALLEANGNSANTQATAFASWRSGGIVTGFVLSLLKSNSGTIGAHGVVANGDAPGVIAFRGDDGTNFQDSARIIGWVDGAPGAGSMPGRLTFQTTPSGSGSTIERLRIDSAGNLSTGGQGNVAGLFGFIPNVGLNSVAGTTQLLEFNHWGANDNANAIYFNKGKSGTIGSHTSGTMGASQGIGSLEFGADDGNAFREAAFISANADGAISAGSAPARLLFATTPSGSVSAVQRLKIDSTGLITTVGWQVINPTSATNPALEINPVAASSQLGFSIGQTGPVSSGGNIPYNQIVATDNSSTGTNNTASGLYINMNTGGANSQGHKYGELILMSHNATTANLGDHIGLLAEVAVASGVTGAGGFWGLNPVMFALANSTVGQLVGVEVNSSVDATATVSYRFGYTAPNTGANVAATLDGAYMVASTTQAGSWKNALILSKSLYGAGALATTGCVICTDGAAATIATGMDLLSYTITGNFLRSTGFTVDGAGDIVAQSAAFTTLSVTAIALDTAHTDRTVCEDTTSHTFFAGSGTLGVCLGTSSARFKHDISDAADGLHAVLDLRPITYFYNRDQGDPSRELYGFTAEDVVNVLPKLVGLDAEGRPNTVDMLGMIPIMVNAIKAQQAEIEAQKAEIEAMKQRVQ